MKIEVQEAQASTPERPLWVWRVWWGGRAISEGFSPNERDANNQAKLVQYPGQGYWRTLGRSGLR
jgi:hypothetical protein